MRNLPICLKSPAQKVSDRCGWEGRVSSSGVQDDFGLLDVDQKIYIRQDTKYHFGYEAQKSFCWDTFKDSLLRLFHSVGEMCCTNILDTISKD